MTENENIEFVFDNATVSASPNVVTTAINKDGSLEKITSVVVINQEQDELALYRKSSKASGMWSRDVYSFSTLKFLEKDKVKYPSPPILGAGAIEYVMGDIRFSATVRLNETSLQNLVTTLRQFK